MALIELESNEALQAFLEANPKALITYSATWCGPCKASKPDLESLATAYSQDASKAKGVKFGIVYEHNIGDDIHSYNVRAFPTYVLFLNKVEFGRIEGVDLKGVQALIDSAPASAAGAGADQGHSLGGGAASLSKEEAREQRLARLGAPSPVTAVAAAKPDKDTDTDTVMNTDTTETTADKDVEMKDADKVEDTSDPAAALDKESLQTLTESMGFSILRAQKGLLFGNGATVASAVDWLMAHQDDDDIDHPIPKGPLQIAQSYKCNDCGKILSNMANLEMHANKTGHSDFEESMDKAPVLTPEEKAKKIAQIKELLKVKRAEREEIEKVEDVDREKQRRTMGKEMAKTKEQMDAEARKREAYLRKKEKDSFKRERERLRAEIARDKAERIANKGKLSTRLGVGGYKPDGVQYEKKDPDAPDDAEDAVQNKKPRAQPAAPSAAKIDDYLSRICSYRAGGDGGKCLKILNAYVGNVVDNPTEDKFKSISMENKAYKGKVKPFVGAKQLLMAVGFSQNEAGTALVLKEDADAQVLTATRVKIKAALDAY
jgi:thiol-disulfide isomerase/thioredoxin